MELCTAPVCKANLRSKPKKGQPSLKQTLTLSASSMLAR
jgi:hypothetical protein